MWGGEGRWKTVRDGDGGWWNWPLALSCGVGARPYGLSAVELGTARLGRAQGMRASTPRISLSR